MKNKHLFFAALFLAALTFGFVGCENPGDLLNNGDDSSITDNDSTTNNPNQGGDNNGGTKPTTPEAPTLVATGGASDVEYSTVTLWGRINTDTLWAFPNIKWGIECSTSKEEMQSHKGKKALCTTDLVGENSDEYTVAFTGLEGGKMLYYNAYLVINDMKYIYGEVDSVHLDVKLTLNRNNTSYGTVTGSGTYDHLAEVSITATPKENYYFASWSDCDSKELSRTITLTSDSTITANFSLNPRLTVQANNSNYGTVTGSGLYEKGTEVSITATPKTNYYFTSWSDGVADNPRTVVVNSDTTFTANFAKKPYLTVNVNSNTNWGKVSGSGYYMPGDEVTITATPNSGAYFVKWNDGNTDNPRTVTINENITYTATFAGNPNGTENGYEWVDLGLPSGLKWATCNVGATSPEEYGNYYAWGEVQPKEVYEWSTYKFMDSSINDKKGITKYTIVDYDTDGVWYDSEGNFIGDNKTTLEKEDDAAAVNMGGNWRMPTIEEQKELKTKCTWTWTTLNGVKGYNVEGPNGNSIFLPAAGFRYGSDLGDAGSVGGYWPSSLSTDYLDNAYTYYLYFYSDNVYCYNYYRYVGLSVRGVFSH